MTRNHLFQPVAAALIVLSLAAGALPAAAQGGEFVTESVPEAAALYLGDMAFLRDTLTLPGGAAVRVLLPPTTLRESLLILENGSRLRSYRLATGSDGRPAVAWQVGGEGGEVAVTLAYLASGAGWTPRYDLDVLDEASVALGFDAEVFNTALDLVEADVRLVAGMPGANPGYGPAMTMTQMNTLYSEPAPMGSVGGPVAINHVYPLGVQTIGRGETLRWNLFAGELAARRLIVWDARLGQQTDVIYKVLNSSDVPFVEGSVYAYQDGLFVGQDSLEWTPSGSEGNVTLGGLSTVRVRRTESVEQIGNFRDDRYKYSATLAITNHGGTALDLTVLDEWNPSGLEYTFSQAPVRQGNNVLRWELTVPAGEQAEITYSFIVD